MPRRLIAPAVLILAVLPGCAQRVSVERTVTLEPGDILQPAIVDAPRGQQKVRVEVGAAEPVDVDVALESDANPIMDALRAGKRPDAAKVLASKQGARNETLEATIPAGKSYTVILSGARKKTEVKLKVNSM